jgi:hypothetical protein
MSCFSLSHESYLKWKRENVNCEIQMWILGSKLSSLSHFDNISLRYLLYITFAIWLSFSLFLLPHFLFIYLSCGIFCLHYVPHFSEFSSSVLLQLCFYCWIAVQTWTLSWILLFIFILKVSLKAAFALICFLQYLSYDMVHVPYVRMVSVCCCWLQCIS